MKAGWQVKKLGEVCGFQNGFAFKSNLFRETGLPIVRISNIQGDELVTDKLVYFDPADYREDLLKFKVMQDDLLIAMSGATTGKIGFNTTDIVFYLNQRVGKFEPGKNLDKKFLYYFLSTKSEESLRISAGSAQPNLSTEQIKNFEMPLPPLAEQQRIVTLLDEAFAGIDAAKANAEQNLSNARSLFDSYLAQVFVSPSFICVNRTLRDVTTKIGSGATPIGGEKSYKDKGISLIRSLNVYDQGFAKRGLAYIDEMQASKLSIVEVQPEDVLLNITGASVARCCMVPEDVLPARVNQHVSIIRPIKEILDSNYLRYLLISKPYKDKLLQTGEEGGSTRQAITKAQLQAFNIEYPKALVDQQAIVTKLDALSAETKKLEAIYRQKIAALDELKQSLLHQAFNGEL